MNQQLRIRNAFESRIILFYLTLFILITLLLLRMVTLQIVQHDGFEKKAQENRIRIYSELPTRGQLLDRFGNVLAANRVAYHVQLVPSRIKEKKQREIDRTLVFLQSRLHWTDAKLQTVRKQVRTSLPNSPILLQDKLTWVEMAPIAARKHHFPALEVLAKTHRYYPYASLTSHVIGYLAQANSDDIKKGYLPMELVGRTGMERFLEHDLRGQIGRYQQEVNARGERLGVLKREPPVLGKSIRLSLDVALQKVAAKALGDRSGAVVVMDVHTGEILCLLSKPGVDSNLFMEGLDSSAWQTILNDPLHPLLNRSIQAVYPPASTFKLISALAGLRHQALIIKSGTQCNGYIKLKDRRIRCWKRSGHQHVDLNKSLVQSCDVFYYKLAAEIGAENILTEAKRWGLGTYTGIELPEKQGSIPSTRKKWFMGNAMITAIGQGAVGVTPLQMARFVAALANGGRLLKPTLLAGKQAVITKTINVKPEQLNKVLRSMRNVVVDPKGTAHRIIHGLPWTVAGKTGTAQVVKIHHRTKGKRLMSKHRDHAWFVGYAPFENPKVAFAVLVENGGHGGSTAAPIAAAIIRKMAIEPPNKTMIR